MTLFAIGAARGGESATMADMKRGRSFDRPPLLRERLFLSSLLAMQLVALDLLFGEAFLAVNLAGLIHVLLVGHSTIPFRSQLLGLISRLSIFFDRGVDLCRADD